MKKAKTSALKIKELRQKTGLSQAKFAKHFGIPTGTLHNWEQSIYEPPVYVVNMIERLCVIDFDV